jgi:hypothetical protein
MIALVYLAVIGAYLIVSVLFVYGIVKFARRKGFKPWLLGVLAALVMYLLVFWDFIPVLIKHNNLCKEQGGFWIYKTPEQWFKENPDAIGKNWAKPGESLRSENIVGGTRYWDSDYIYSESFFDRNYAHAIRRFEERLFDARTGEVLARVVDFERGGGNPMLHADSIVDYKFWLGVGNNNCGAAEATYLMDYIKIARKYKMKGRGENEK